MFFLKLLILFLIIYLVFFHCVEIPISYQIMRGDSNKSFKLYGEDLRCLDSGKPMMGVFEYDSDIQTTIDNARIRLETFVKNPQNQEEWCMRIKRIRQNEFMYDSEATVDHYFETTDETDPVKIFNKFDRTTHLIKCFCSLK